LNPNAINPPTHPPHPSSHPPITTTPGAYFMKAVAFRTNFEGADLSDVLMDR
jgi:hypothetical protein